jgi:hypothetical protein
LTSLRLTVGQQICVHKGCGKPGTIFGVCLDHEDAAIRTVFSNAVQAGHCPYEAPRCFSSHQKWREYVAACMISRKEESGIISHCRDCTPEYKAAMMRDGLCDHPETVFIRSRQFNGEVVGICIDSRVKRTAKWEQAVMGLSGEIVQMPPSEVIEQKLAKISEDAAPKKRGPRFMKDRV